MGRIFISAAHGGREAGGVDPGSIAGERRKLRDDSVTRFNCDRIAIAEF